MKIDIALAQESDAEAILILQKRAFLSEAKRYDNFKIAPLSQTLEEIQTDFSTHTFIKALWNETIVGSVKIRVVQGKCGVERVIVDPDLQRNGIGSTLLSAVETIVPDVKEYFLFTGSESSENIRFYQKAGYSINGQTIEDSGISLVGMSKRKLLGKADQD